MLGKYTAGRRSVAFKEFSMNMLFDLKIVRYVQTIVPDEMTNERQ